ncbi:hypothetical protein QTP88_014566 [Uroleucon formosanum]
MTYDRLRLWQGQNGKRSMNQIVVGFTGITAGLLLIRSSSYPKNNSIEHELNIESDNIDTDKMFNVDKNMFENSVLNTHTDLEKQITKDVNSIFDFNDPATWPEYINNDLKVDFVKHV